MEHLKRLIEHLAWADARTLGSLEGLPSVEPKTLGLYGHVLAAEHVWITRIRGRATTVSVWPELSVAECRQLAAENAAELRSLAAELDRAGAERGVTYTNTAGLTFTSTVHDILLHACLHGQYHRGQVALAVRAAGGTPAVTDFIAYARLNA